MNCTSEGFPRQLSFKTDTHSFELVLKSKNRLEISCKDLPTKNGNVFYKCVITPKQFVTKSNQIVKSIQYIFNYISKLQLKGNESTNGHGLSLNRRVSVSENTQGESKQIVRRLRIVFIQQVNGNIIKSLKEYPLTTEIIDEAEVRKKELELIVAKEKQILRQQLENFQMKQQVTFSQSMDMIVRKIKKLIKKDKKIKKYKKKKSRKQKKKKKSKKKSKEKKRRHQRKNSDSFNNENEQCLNGNELLQQYSEEGIVEPEEICLKKRVVDDDILEDHFVLLQQREEEQLIKKQRKRQNKLNMYKQQTVVRHQEDLTGMTKLRPKHVVVQAQNEELRMREENNHTNPKRVKHGKISQDQKEEKKSRNTNKNDKNINVDVEKVDEDVPADLDRYCHIIDEFNRDYNGVSMFKSGPNYYQSIPKEPLIGSQNINGITHIPVSFLKNIPSFNYFQIRDNIVYKRSENGYKCIVINYPLPKTSQACLTMRIIESKRFYIWYGLTEVSNIEVEQSLFDRKGTIAYSCHTGHVVQNRKWQKDKHGRLSNGLSVTMTIDLMNHMNVTWNVSDGRGAICSIHKNNRNKTLMPFAEIMDPNDGVSFESSFIT